MTSVPTSSPVFWIAAALGVSSPLVVLAAAMGSDIGWIGFEPAVGFLTLTLGWWLAVLGTVGGVVVLVLSVRRLRRTWPWLVFSLLIPASMLCGFVWVKARADALPPIHETATDWTQPLGFSHLLRTARGETAWPVSGDPVVSGAVVDIRPAWAVWAGRPVSEINAETCPGARTVPRLVPPEEVVAALEAEGVRVLGVSLWRVEGTQTSAFYGRARDVVVRMEPGSTDLRVVERVGLIDLGDTCGLAARVVARLSG
jgi:fatty-acyl-CoA synthase